MKNKFSRCLSWLLVFAMVIMNVPTERVAWAESNSNEVRVIIINNTFSKADGAKWEGTLLDTKVELKPSSNAITVIEDAVKSAGYTITGAESNYITEIGGLSAFDGGSMSGWTGTLNDWFTSEAFNTYAVSNGKLQAGDEICMWYSCNWGADIGSDWSGSSTALKSIAFSTGALSSGFDSKVTDYTLVIPDDAKEVVVTPTAENKNFMVKTYKNNYTPTAGGDYKRGQAIPVTSGDKIIVGVGNTNWPSMNSGQTETVYNFTVKYASEAVTKPVFEQINFSAFSIDGWVVNETYKADILEYNIGIKNYGTSSLMLQSSTKYDAEKYDAVAKYVDSNGDDRNIEIKNGSYTTLNNLKFGLNKVEFVISEKENKSNSTTYVFNITRPYDTSIGLSTSKGLVVSPEGRSLLTTLYMDKPEGTMFKSDDNGELSSAGMSSDCYNYKTFVLDGLESFKITLNGRTSYVRMRISEDGENFTEVKNGENSPIYSFNGADEKKLYVQTVSDSEYLDNGFANVKTSGNEYTLTVVSVKADTMNAKLISADSFGDWYPQFNKDIYSYGIVIGNSDDFPELTFKAAEGAKVIIGSEELVPDAEGNYSITLKTAQQQIKIQAENGIVNTYSFKAVKKSKYEVPDKVTDYLCINSQYTNSSFGTEPMLTLGGSLKSLGNFGGYITYYYENAITDNPNNMYGIDFYVYGNSFSQGGSAAETGQVWVSEDGEKWYALAGSEHYEDTTLKDYEITYTKTASGKTAWTDNYGGSNDGTSKAGQWVNSSVYYLNDLAKNDSITLKGILIPCIDGSLYGDGSTSSFVGETKFGYVDYNVNGTIGADVNPYVESAKSNGFDLKWAVDEDGNPVELKNGVHYIKVVTASNIWAGGFGEKSTEVSSMVRTSATENEVGVTKAPKSVVITNENNKETIVNIEAGIQSYDVKIDDSRKVSISLNGAGEDDNIYVNNKRIAYDESVEISAGEQGRKVRIIIQNGEKEPVIFILNIVSDSISKVQNIFNETTDYLLNGETPIVNSTGGEWKVISLARADRISDDFKQGYFKNAYEYVKSIGSAKLHRSKSTDNSRMILALTSLGYDVTDVAGQNIITPLSDYDYVIKQGINGASWALMALDSAGYDIPELNGEGTQTSRDNLIQYILDSQLENGGFTLDDENADVDITAMALQSLAPYYLSDDTDEELKDKINTAVEKALNYLSDIQESTGAFGNYNAENCESTAQVIAALTSLGINPRTDSRFIKNGTSVLTALCSYYLGNGQFAHTVNGDENEMSTEQAYLALVSYHRFINSQSALYNMKDVVIGKNPVIKDNSGDSNNDDNNSNGDNNNNDNNNSNSSNNGNDGSNINDENNNSLTDSKPTGSKPPKTGDYPFILLYAVLMSSSAAGIYVIAKHKKKSNCKQV